MLRSHALVQLAALFRCDLTIAVGVGHVEMLECSSLGLLKRHPAVLVGVRHLEHVTAKAHAAHSAVPEATGIRPAVAITVARSHPLFAPGGVGTMDELWEAISWAQLGYHTKPVGLLNAAGFYNDLIAFNRKMVEVGFIRPAHAGIMIVDAGLDELLAKMAGYEPHQTIFAMKAENL